MNEDDRVLEEQSAHVRNLYCEARRRFLAARGIPSSFGNQPVPRWDGGTDAAGVKHKPIWPKILCFCAANSFNPSILIKAVFANGKGPEPPPPTRLYGGYAFGLYAQQAQIEKTHLRQSLIYYSDQANKYYHSFAARDDTEPGETWRTVLRRNPPMLSALYRYCVATRLGFDDIAAEHASTAFTEYFWSKDAYDEVWSDWIPESLRAEGTALAERLRGADAKISMNDDTAAAGYERDSNRDNR
jgi:hypothetical protein